MAKKKRVTKRDSPSKKLIRSTQRKVSLVLKNLILFIILFVVSLVLYAGASIEIYVNLFGILSIIFGFLALTFLIVFLIFVFMKVFKK